MVTRKLGKTGWKIPLFSLGGQSILEYDGPGDKETAIEIIQRFISSGGKYIDTSPIYFAKTQRTSEKTIGEAIKNYCRDDIYIATKTHERDEEKAWEDINKSVEALGTTPDCIQVHSVEQNKDIDDIFSKDGAMKALLRAKDQKLTKFIGITGHYNPNVILYGLSKYRFDTVLGAFNAADAHMKSVSFQKELIPYCQEHDIGFIAMKTCARGALFNAVNSMEDLLYYVWSFPVATAIIGINNISQLDRNMNLARDFKPIQNLRKERIEAATSEGARKFMFFSKNGDNKLWKHYARGKDTPEFIL